MRLPETMDNVSGCQFEAHILDLPECCPISKNPRPGSTITICYRPDAFKLEVIALRAYISQYRGGLRDEQGEIIVRDMEGMIARIAADCARVVCVPVRVFASLIVRPQQVMRLLARGYP